MRNQQQSEIQVGDMVHLNSGSPELKVTNLNGEDACVAWSNGKGEMQQHTFPLSCLTPQSVPESAREYFVKMGRMGGRLGGKIRAEKLTPEQRSEAARKAVQARWAKKKRD